MKTAVKHRRLTCRICASSLLRTLLEFENVPSFDEVVPAAHAGTEFLGPVTVGVCEVCGVAQSLDDLDGAAYYGEYEYSASASPQMRSYMNSLADQCWYESGADEGDLAVDVGAADGFLLECFAGLGATAVGYEPAGNLAAAGRERGINMIEGLFDEAAAMRLLEMERPVRALTTLHTLDHMQDPVGFLRLCRSVLRPHQGMLVIEVHDLDQIRDKNEVALFGHEHLTFFSPDSLRRVLRNCGFRPLEMELVPSRLLRGSSMLIASVPVEGDLISWTDMPDHREQVDSDLFFLDSFSRGVESRLDRLRTYVRSQRSVGRRLAGYGGWGRSVTALAMAGLGPADFECVFDQNTALHGCVTPGTHIPIKGPEEALLLDIDEIVVFNYAYLDEIKAGLSQFIGQGGTVVPVTEIM
jgi:novobiocin biosynthesis protein NovU/D-mycarose 3-C-methyltransferase